MLRDMNGLENEGSGLGDLDDWRLLCRFLPAGWREQARTSGALRRARGVDSPEALLRILLLHVGQGCSLQETAVRARQMGLGQLSSVAVFKRLRASEQWLRWLAEQLRGSTMGAVASLGRRVLAVDATTICEPGSTGTDWRLHYALNLADLQCDYFELSDVRGGESWRRFPVQAGDVLLGDRVYATPAGVSHVVEKGGDVVTRIKFQGVPLRDEKGRPVSILRRAGRSRVGQVHESSAAMAVPQGDPVAGRLIIVKRSREATRAARRRLERQASRKQKQLSEGSWKAAQYFFLWSTLGEQVGATTLLELYRFRWQIELLFKRLKTILNLGHLPKKDPASARAWLHGKVFVGLLAEKVAAAADSFSPWGYPLEQPPELLAGNRVSLS